MSASAPARGAARAGPATLVRSPQAAFPVPAGELRQGLTYALGDGMHADGRARYASDVALHHQPVVDGLATELAPPGLVGHFAAVGLAIDQDVHVFEPVRGIEGDQEGDGLVF